MVIMSSTTPLEEKRAKKIIEDKAAEAAAEAELDASMPHPCGYHVLIALPQVEETFGELGLIKADKTMRDEQILSFIGLVLDMGEEAYASEERFPNGPWCKVSDYMMFRANAGTRFKIGNQEYRLLNDDSIEAVVPNPRAITRAN